MVPRVYGLGSIIILKNSSGNTDNGNYGSHNCTNGNSNNGKLSGS